jgi:hypothetical protein
MTHTDQHKIILELADYQGKMGRYDQEDFAMFMKRDKDDEDLDEQSRKRLMDLYRKYVPERKRNY